MKRGDRVALVMENRPEFIMCWLGMTKIGVEVALINYNLRSRSLVHCISVSHASYCVFGIEVAEAIQQVLPQLKELGASPIVWGGSVDFAPSIDAALEDSSTHPVDPAFYNGVTMEDTFGYIYTSGTTGLPKAAVIKHAKVRTQACCFRPEKSNHTYVQQYSVTQLECYLFDLDDRFWHRFLSCLSNWQQRPHLLLFAFVPFCRWWLWHWNDALRRYCAINVIHGCGCVLVITVSFW